MSILLFFPWRGLWGRNFFTALVWSEESNLRKNVRFCYFCWCWWFLQTHVYFAYEVYWHVCVISLSLAPHSHTLSVRFHLFCSYLACIYIKRQTNILMMHDFKLIVLPANLSPSLSLCLTHFVCVCIHIVFGISHSFSQFRIVSSLFFSCFVCQVLRQKIYSNSIAFHHAIYMPAFCNTSRTKKRMITKNRIKKISPKNFHFPFIHPSIYPSPLYLRSILCWFSLLCMFPHWCI